MNLSRRSSSDGQLYGAMDSYSQDIRFAALDGEHFASSNELKESTMKILPLIVFAFVVQHAAAETVQVKYHGAVALDSFDCVDVREASDVSRICFDQPQQYMLIRLKATYYHYCQIDASTVTALRGAQSKRKYFEAKIRGSGDDGPFDCRTHPIPKKYRL